MLHIAASPEKELMCLNLDLRQSFANFNEHNP